MRWADLLGRNTWNVVRCLRYAFCDGAVLLPLDCCARRLKQNKRAGFQWRCISRFYTLPYTDRLEWEISLHLPYASAVSLMLSAWLSPPRAGSLGIRSGRHAHAPGSSSSASCCCNGSVGLNWHTTCIWYFEVWELKAFFLPIRGRIKYINKTKSNHKITPDRNSRSISR